MAFRLYYIVASAHLGGCVGMLYGGEKAFASIKHANDYKETMATVSAGAIFGGSTGFVLGPLLFPFLYVGGGLVVYEEAKRQL